MSSPRAEHELAVEYRGFTKLWWAPLVLGVLWVLFGLVVLSAEVTTVWAVALLFGISSIVGGIADIAEAQQATSWRWVSVLLGAASVVVGIVALVWPDATFLVLAALVGWVAMIVGVAHVIVGLTSRHENDLWWTVLLMGALEIGLGLWAVGYDGRSVALLILWVGAAAIGRGITTILLAFGLRDIDQQLEGHLV
jgi:uncharacterized membrane protein HdeD (DUF308 family)